MTATRGPQPWPGSTTVRGDWLEDAAAELERLGFVLRDGSQPGTVPGPRLLVALRDRPTLEHFDPEEVSYWVAHAGRSHLATFDRRSTLPMLGTYEWGRIQVSDRIPVSNEFLSFGGTLLAAARDEHETVIAFVSRAPIVRWAGHSQGVDPFADEIGAFFGRLMVPVDYQEGAEARITEVEPEALYAAFLVHAAGRLRPGSPLRDADPALAGNVDHEAHRLEHDVPEAWQQGRDLLGWLQLG